MQHISHALTGLLIDGLLHAAPPDFQYTAGGIHAAEGGVFAFVASVGFFFLLFRLFLPHPAPVR